MVARSRKHSPRRRVETSVSSQTNVYANKKTRKYLTTVTDVCLLNYAVSLDEARDGTQKNTQGVWPCKLPIDSLSLQQLGLSPALMSSLSKQPRRWFPTAPVADTVQK